MWKNQMLSFVKKVTPGPTDTSPSERRPLGAARQLPSAAVSPKPKGAKVSGAAAVSPGAKSTTSVSSDSTIRPNKVKAQAQPVLRTPVPIRGEAARLEHPLPAALVSLDPYAPSKATLLRRPESPGLRRKKSDSTLQLHRENTLAELAGPVKESEVDRKAREKWRFMLGGREGHFPTASAGSDTAFLIEGVVHADETFLKRCERSSTGLSQGQRAEVEHIARYGLSAHTRERARGVLKQHDPYLRLMWRKVNNPAAQAARVVRDVAPAAPGKSFTPTIHLVQKGQLGCNGAAATPAIAEVRADSGARYLVAEPSSSGSFKRFSVGLTQDGQPIGVLLMRGPGSRDVFGDAFGEDLDLQTISEEIKSLSSFSDAFEIYDAFPVHNVWYVMIPLFNAGSVSDMFTRLPSEKRYSVAMRLLPNMLEQILTLHKDHGALHKDVKMDNFFCTTLGKVFLADFGLAAKLDATRVVHEGFGGTFFAPEQVHGMRVTPSVDLWALGASLGELFVPYRRGPRGAVNPHYAAMDDEGEFDPKLHLAQLDLFNGFRKQLFDQRSEGLFDMGRLHRLTLTPQTHPALANLVHYYREFDVKAPLLARFCLEHLLEPNPALRSDEDGRVLLQLARIMADAMGVGELSSDAPQFPINEKIAQAIEALHTAQLRCKQHHALAA